MPVYIPTNSAWGCPFFPHVHQPLLSLVFLIIVIPTGVPTEVLVCISLMIGDIEDLFKDLLVIFLMTEDEMIGWHHRLDGHKFEQALGVSDGQGSPWATVHEVSKSRT